LNGRNESEKNQNKKVDDEPEASHLFIRGKLDRAEDLNVELLKKIHAGVRGKLSELIQRASSIPQSQRKKFDREAHFTYKTLNKTQMAIDFCSAITIDLFRKSDSYNPAPLEKPPTTSRRQKLALSLRFAVWCVDKLFGKHMDKDFLLDFGAEMELIYPIVRQVTANARDLESLSLLKVCVCYWLHIYFTYVLKSTPSCGKLLQMTGMSSL
jgi:hypothetical protein